MSRTNDPENSDSQTKGSFFQKWSEGKRYFFDATMNENSEIQNWILERNGLGDTNGLTHWLADKKRILDAGCGNGRVTSLLSKYSPATTKIVGIDFASHEVAQQNLQSDSKVTVQFGDLMGDLASLGKFDLIYCQEVLHHTTSPRSAFENLRSLLNEEGELAIYVYKEKAVLREYAENYIRERIVELSYEESRQVIQEITVFAREISKLTDKIRFPPLEPFGIREQESTIQRFIYNNFLKNFGTTSFPSKRISRLTLIGITPNYVLDTQGMRLSIGSSPVDSLLFTH